MSFIHSPARKNWCALSPRRVLHKPDTNPNAKVHFPLAWVLEWNQYVLSRKNHGYSKREGATA